MAVIHPKIAVIIIAFSFFGSSCYGCDLDNISVIEISRKNQGNSFLKAWELIPANIIKLTGEGSEISLKTSIPKDVVVIARVICRADGWKYKDVFYPLGTVNNSYTRLIGAIVKEVSEAEENPNLGIVFVPVNESISIYTFFLRVKAVAGLIPKAKPFLSAPEKG
jgi:hypothetical protein